jgi:hypothetical protein
VVEGAIKYPGQAEVIYKWQLPSGFDRRSSITMKQTVNATQLAVILGVSERRIRQPVIDPSGTSTIWEQPNGNATVIGPNGRSQDDDRASRSSHSSLRHRRNRQRKLAVQKSRLTPPHSPRLRNLQKIGCTCDRRLLSIASSETSSPERRRVPAMRRGPSASERRPALANRRAASYRIGRAATAASSLHSLALASPAVYRS